MTTDRKPPVRAAADAVREGRGRARTQLLAALIALTAALAVSWAASTARAEPAIPCGAIYAVRAGDTLHKIAMRAYGVGNYRAIFRANRNLLPDVASLEIEDLLLVPCLDGTGPQNRAEAVALGLLPPPAAPASALAAPMASAASAVVDAPGVRLLTGSDFAPFADRDLPEGGLTVELVRLSLARAEPGLPTRLTFLDDWSQHLELLRAGDFDLGLPWYKPDCTRADLLAGSMRERCSGLVFSNPLYAVHMGFYVRAGDPLGSAETPEALTGRRICRPAGYFTFDLDQAKLRPPRVTRVAPPTAADCLDMLAGGMVDVVSLSAELAARELTRLGLDRQVVAIPALASTQTLHAVAPEASPAGQTHIELINAGLAELQNSGQWFEVVSRHLGAFGLRMR